MLMLTLSANKVYVSRINGSIILMKLVKSELLPVTLV